MSTITLLSANLWLLPPPASSNNFQRLDSFLEMVKKLKVDVINLQEVWLNQYVTYIKKYLKNYYLVKPDSIFFNKSGLVSFLKYKPISSNFKYFNTLNDFRITEKVAAKGLLRCQFVKNDQTYTIINTHVYESPHKTKLKIKLDQAKQIINWAKKHNPTIIAGDLNIKPKKIQQVFSDFIKEEEVLTTYSEKNKYAYQMFNFINNKNGIYNFFPDRILLNLKSKNGRIRTKIIKKPLISDHYPLYAEIEIP